MTTESAGAPASLAIAAERHFLLRKLHSLTGIVPLGLFFVEHMVSNFSAVGASGPAKFNETVAFLRGLPLVLGLEVFGIFLPLLFHGVLGMWIAFEGRVNVHRYPSGRNAMYVLQRVSGAVTLVFVVFHLLHFRFKAHAQPFEQIAFQEVSTLLADPAWLAAYVLGVAATAFHLGNGVPLFCISWGLTITPRSQQRMNWVGVGVGSGLFVLGLASALAFHG